MCVCVCVCVFIKLRITAQSGPVIILRINSVNTFFSLYMCIYIYIFIYLFFGGGRRDFTKDKMEANVFSQETADLKP